MKAKPRPLASCVKTRKCITSCQQERPKYKVTYSALTLWIYSRFVTALRMYIMVYLGCTDVSQAF